MSVMLSVALTVLEILRGAAEEERVGPDGVLGRPWRDCRTRNFSKYISCIIKTNSKGGGREQEEKEENKQKTKHIKKQKENKKKKKQQTKQNKDTSKFISRGFLSTGIEFV
jgi:hypothetical protein